MDSRKKLLNSLLQALVDEWGPREVGAALAQLAESRRGVLSRPSAKDSLRNVQRPKTTKLRATEQLERAQIDQEKREALRELAERFDAKQILPSVADVRELLIMMGERPGAIKDRSDAFRWLLKTLAELPLQRLQQTSGAAVRSGPSQLGPLSDAISAAGDSIPRRRSPGAS